MWNNAPLIYEDEDEAELKAAYISARIKYPNYDIFSIADYVFRNQRDPELRGRQAATIWEKDLETQEAIRKGQINGEEEEALTKSQLQAKILAVTENDNLTAQEKKVRIEGYMAYAENEGWRIKAVDKKSTKTNTGRREIIFAQRQDD